MSKILIAHPDKKRKDHFTAILEAANYKVTCCSNGLEALEIVKYEHFDIILSAIAMEELDGYALIHLLNKDINTSQIPLIFLSENNDYSVIRKCMNLGADDCFLLPIDDIELLNSIENRLSRNKNVKDSYYRALKGDDDDLTVLLDFKDIQKHSKSTFYRTKDIIYRAGDSTHYLYFVNEGSAKTYLYNKDGKEFITGIFEEGTFFGYQAVFEDRSHNEYAEALEESNITKIDKQSFHNLILKNSELTYRFLKMMSESLTMTEENLLHLAYSSVRKRLARCLLKQNSRNKQNEIHISRTDLANIIGTSTETLVRTLTEMKESKLIDTNNDSITILDIDGVKKLEKTS